MAKSIYDLSAYQMYRLQSLHPIFSDDWKQILQDTVLTLDKDSQNVIYKRILLPSGIYFDAQNKRFDYKKAPRLKNFLSGQSVSHPEIRQIIQRIQTLLGFSDSHLNDINSNHENTNNTTANTPISQQKIDIKTYADQIEGVLSVMNQLNLGQYTAEKQFLQELRQAFLYELLYWIDSVDFDPPKGLRQLDKHIIRTYFKEVFVKQQIQGWDFRYLDASDIESLQMTHFPNKLAQWAKERALFVSETKDYWFLIGQPSSNNQNAFSFSRFLHEDGEGYYIYLSHVVVPRAKLNNPDVVKAVAYEVSRLYALDKGISEAVLKFIQESKQYQEKHLRELMKQPLVNDGTGAENITNHRLVEYEKRLSLFILNKLPSVIESLAQNVNDSDYLYYQFNNIIKECYYSIEDFRLQPLASYAVCAEKMSIRLMSYNLLLQKNQNLLSSPNLNMEDKSAKLTQVCQDIISLFEEFKEERENIAQIKERTLALMRGEGQKTLWQKLGLGKKEPEYSLEEIKEASDDLDEAFFMNIIKMAKSNPNSMTYIEFETNQIYNPDYRHYAFFYGDKAVDRLPRLVRLPEDRNIFDFESTRSDIFFDVFKKNQEW